MHATEYFTTSHSQGNGLPEKTDWTEWVVDVSHYEKALPVKEPGWFRWEKKREKSSSFNVAQPTNLCSMMVLSFKMSKVWADPKIKLIYLKLVIWRTLLWLLPTHAVLRPILPWPLLIQCPLLTKNVYMSSKISFSHCSQATKIYSE